MIFEISFICWLSIIWFKTDSFIVYSKLFKVNKFFHINNWELYKNTQDCSVGYHQYLKIIHVNGFFTKLVTCPICLITWLSVPILYFNVYEYPIVCLSSMFIYFTFIKLM